MDTQYQSEDKKAESASIIRVENLSPQYKELLAKFEDSLVKITEINTQLQEDPENEELVGKLSDFKRIRDTNFTSFLEIVKINAEHLEKYLEEYESSIEFSIAKLDDSKRSDIRAMLRATFPKDKGFKILRGNKSLVLYLEKNEEDREEFSEDDGEEWCMEDIAKEKLEAKKAKLDEFKSYPADLDKIWFQDFDPYLNKLTVWIRAPFDFGEAVIQYRLRIQYLDGEFEQIKQVKKEYKFTVLDQKVDNEDGKIHVLSFVIDPPKGSRFINLNLQAENKHGSSVKPLKSQFQLPENFSKARKFSIIGQAKYGQIDSILTSDEHKTRLEAIEAELDGMEDIQTLQNDPEIGQTGGLIPQSFKNMEGSKLEISDLKVNKSSVCLVNRWQIIQWGQYLSENEETKAAQLGQSSIFTPYTKMKTSPDLFCKVIVGENYCLALSCLGQVYSWGMNGFGQLGHGDCKYRISPEKIQFFEDQKEQIVDIQTGHFQVLALTRKGQVYSWGIGQGLVSAKPIKDRHDFTMNFEGDAYKSQDKQILISKNFVYDTDPVVLIACGHDHSGFLTKSGKVYLWGGNLNHQVCDQPWIYPILPIYQTIDSEKPNLKFKHIELTEEETFALTEDGTLYYRGGSSNSKTTHNSSFKESLVWKKIEVKLSEDGSNQTITKIRAGNKSVFVWTEEGTLLRAGPKSFQGLDEKAQGENNCWSLVMVDAYDLQVGEELLVLSQ